MAELEQGHRPPGLPRSRSGSPTGDVLQSAPGSSEGRDTSQGCIGLSLIQETPGPGTPGMVRRSLEVTDQDAHIHILQLHLAHDAVVDRILV
jgi:hypothetical protein